MSLDESQGGWRGTAAAAVAGRSLLDLLREAGAASRTIAFAQALRGFFAADAPQISALVAVGQLRERNPGAVRMSRVAGGADRIISTLEEEARFPIELHDVTSPRPAAGPGRPLTRPRLVPTPCHVVPSVWRNSSSDQGWPHGPSFTSSRL